MGSSPSKQSTGQPHVFAAEGPISFSEGLVDSLQKNPDSDSTRAKNLELQIQERVQAELKKLQASATEKLSAAADSVSKEPYKPAPEPKRSAPSSTSSNTSWTEKPLLNRLGEKIWGSSPPEDSHTFKPNLDSTGVSKEIDELRKKLESRKKLVEADKDVSNAKEEVVKCLRLNDRRPLDCWKEVETFKAEVGRLEKAFVDRNGA